MSIKGLEVVIGPLTTAERKAVLRRVQVLEARYRADRRTAIYISAIWAIALLIVLLFGR